MNDNKYKLPLTTSQTALIETFQSCRQGFIDAYLRKAGLADLELRARLELIPRKIHRVIPESRAGIGLIGGFRVGKTSALAALIRQEAENSVDEIMARMIARPEEEFLLRDAIRTSRLPGRPVISWVNWSSEIPSQRAKLFLRDSQGEVEGWIQDKLLNSKITLILDDIGADKVTSQDWSGDVLGRVIDERLRRERRTFWTSNFEPLALAERYGVRTFSRLQELAPAIELPSLPVFDPGTAR